MKIKVNVHFDGVVEADVPDNLSEQDARLLAEHLVLARMVAVSDDPDAPDEDAFEEYQDKCSKDARYTSDIDWDTSKVSGVCGKWTGEIAVDTDVDMGLTIRDFLKAKKGRNDE